MRLLSEEFRKHEIQLDFEDSNESKERRETTNRQNRERLSMIDT
jgi:hypothetical protein